MISGVGRYLDIVAAADIYQALNQGGRLAGSLGNRSHEIFPLQSKELERKLAQDTRADSENTKKCASRNVLRPAKFRTRLTLYH